MDSLETLSRRVLAPAAGAFTQWVLKRALEDRVSRLYFLARDGWYFYRLARGLCAAWSLPLDCRYLYGSRYAWRMPLYGQDPVRAVSQLCGKALGLTPGRVLEQAGLSPGERREILVALGVEEAAPLSSSRERNVLKRKLLDCPAFLQGLRDRSRMALPPFAGYLRQEGLLDGTSWALVDSGWMGSTQETLAQALSLLGRRETPRGYYAGLYRAPTAGLWDCCFFRPGKDLKRQAVFEPSLFEGVFSAPQGMTLGYRKQGSRFVPVLGKPRPPLPSLEQALLRQGEGLGKRPPFGEQAWERALAWSNLARLMTRPTREQALTLGGLAFSDGPLEQEGLLAQPLTRRELRDSLLLSRVLGRNPLRSSPWMPGSAALSPVDPEPVFRALDRLRLARVLGLAGREILAHWEEWTWKKENEGGSTGLSSSSSPPGN